MWQDPGLEGLSNLMAPSNHSDSISPISEEQGPITNPTSLEKFIDEVVLQALPALVKAVTKSNSSKRKSSPRSFSPSSSGSKVSPPSPPKKRQRETKHLEYRKLKCSKPSKKCRSKHLSFSSLSSSSESDLEEGEISGAETEDKTHKQDRLFLPGFFEALVDSSSSCLNLLKPCDLASDSDEDKAEAFPKADSKHAIVPFPKAFQKVFPQEWHSNSKGVGPCLVNKFYSLREKQMALLKYLLWMLLWQL